MNNFFRKQVLTLSLLAVAVKPLYAQHESFIYGEVIMKNKQSYTGQIRWSAGQVLWGDILIANKKDNPLLKYLSKEQLKNLSSDKASDGVDWQFLNLWRSSYPTRTHAIKVRFGDMLSIRPMEDKQAILTFKDGTTLTVVADEDNSWNLGKDITVYDNQRRETRLEWDEIDKIRFLPAPSFLSNIKGVPVYGTVITSSGPVTGIILWDRTKCLTTSRLYGKTNMGRYVNYSFAEIKSIEKRDRGAFVKFRSGDELMLRESRDVNYSNRGIIVLDPVSGRTIVEWQAFQSVSFQESIPRGLDYNSYYKPKKLQGDIRSDDNQVYKGNFVFDLDEALSIELLDGNSRAGIDYQIPFSNISKLSPAGEHYSDVTLKNGDRLHLGEQDDVTERNWGLMLWLPHSKYKYFPWDHVAEITFK